MSLKRGIRCFLEDIDPVILTRGKDYYRSKRVKRIDWEESHAAAEVSGREKEPYLVELNFSENGEVKDWSCDCPMIGDLCVNTQWRRCWLSKQTRLKTLEKKPRAKKQIFGR